MKIVLRKKGFKKFSVLDWYKNKLKIEIRAVMSAISVSLNINKLNTSLSLGS
jgi:hypothetical protein